MMKKIHTLCAVTLSLGLASVGAQAATITWGTPTAVTANGLTATTSDDISLNGSLLYGMSLYTPTGNNPNSGFVDGTATTVSGVLFDLPTVDGNVTYAGTSQTMNGGTNSPPQTARLPVPTVLGDPEGDDFAYAKLFLSNTFNANAANSTMTLNNLTGGNEYEVQVFVGDNRYGGTAATTVDGISLLIDQGTYMIGTFTADAMSQDLTLGGDGVFTALQVRTIPEPGSVVLLLGGLGLLVMRRRRA